MVLAAPPKKPAHDGADTVSEKGFIKTGIGDQIPLDDRAEVLMVGDMLGKLHHRNRNEGEGDIADGGGVNGCTPAGVSPITPSAFKKVNLG